MATTSVGQASRRSRLDRRQLRLQSRAATVRPSGLSHRRGSALLMVLWISAALAAVAFSLANTVRGETDRTSTELDEVRGYYLATGAVDRAAVELLWSVSAQGERKIKQGSAWVDYTFPTGVAHVELIPETAKLDVNSVPPDRLVRLLTALGVEPGPAMEITRAIVARRGGAPAPLSLPPGPSFPAPGASFQEIEELLSVRGITPELFYGTYVPAQGDPGPGEPRLIRRSGLVDCLSVFGSKSQVDANTADPAVLAAIGIDAGWHPVAAAPAADRAAHSRTPRPTDAACSVRPGSCCAWRATPSSPSAPRRACGWPTGSSPT